MEESTRIDSESIIATIKESEITEKREENTSSPQKKKLKNKVLLVYPKTGFDALRPRMPLTFILLATILREHGFETIIVDTRVDKNFKELIEKHVKDAVAVGISSMTGPQILFALALAKSLRKLNPDVKLIWGGVHPTLMPKQTAENEFVDILVKKEGETAFVNLIQKLQKGEDWTNVKGICYKNKYGKVIENEDEEFVDLKSLPKPDRGMVDQDKYRIFDVESARGCPFRCNYCYNVMFNKQRWRPKPATYVVDEIQEILTNYKVDEINFIDDMFVTDIKRAKDIMEDIIKRDLKFTWRTNWRVDYFDRFDMDFLHLAHKAGLRELQFGLETGSERILELVKKDATLKQARNAVDMAMKAGIQPQCSFMIGFPWETKKDNNKTFDFIDELRSKYPGILINMIAMYTPYPGAELFEISKEYGYIPPKSFEEWGNYSYTYINVPWIKGHKRWQYESISLISRFYFFEKELKKRFITPLLYLPYLILNWDAKIRWKTRFFKFPFEWMVVKGYFNYKRSKELKKIKREVDQTTI